MVRPIAKDGTGYGDLDFTVVEKKRVQSRADHRYERGYDTAVSICCLPLIDLKHIHCASSLHDRCGVVFQYGGRFFRALLPRGMKIFELLCKDGWMEDLAKKGLARMKLTDLRLPGYQGIIELERLEPITPPSMWTTNMLAEAGLAVCRLSKELLRNGLIIWDLKKMTNMTFSPQRGPLLIDIGAIYTVDEIENNILTTSPQSLIDQIASSFYAPLWLAHSRLGRWPSVQHLLEHKRAEEGYLAIASSLLRKMTMGWRLVPGLIKARDLLQARHYPEFYDLLAKRVQAWMNGELSKAPVEAGTIDNNLCSGSQLPMDLLKVVDEAIEGIDGQTIFDLNPEGEFGPKMVANYRPALYLVTKDTVRAEKYFNGRGDRYRNILPLLCDIWDRSLKNAQILRNSRDLVILMPDVITVDITSRVPLDFMGQVLSLMTKRFAIVGVDPTSQAGGFSSFVTPAGHGVDRVDFAKDIIGKYFGHCEAVKNFHAPNLALLIFRK